MKTIKLTEEQQAHQDACRRRLPCPAGGGRGAAEPPRPRTRYIDQAEPAGASATPSGPLASDSSLFFARAPWQCHAGGTGSAAARAIKQTASTTPNRSKDFTVTMGP